MSEKPEKLTLAEKNRIYQQRHRVKVRKALGIDKYREEVRTYMKQYREQRNKKEGYVKPQPVVKLAEPAIEPPVRIKKEIELKDIKKKTKNNKQEAQRLQLLKLNLKSKTLAQKSIEGYLSKHSTMYGLFTGDPKADTMGGWKSEFLKVLQNRDYDHGLHEVISYFKEIQQVVKALREMHSNDNTFKGYIGAITALLGRLDNAYEAEYEYVSTIGIALQKEYTEVRDLNELTAEELAKINKIKFDDKSIEDNVKKLTNLKDKALYATYMYIPRRLEMSTVRIRNNENNTQKSGNYLILHNTLPDRFIFNDYKTSHTYHRQVVDVPEQIEPILHEYILENKLETDNFLFPLGRSKKEADSNFSKTFSRVFTEVYGQKLEQGTRRKKEDTFTNQDLRTAYATYWNGKARNKADKNKVSNALSHSFEVNEQYVKTNVKKE